MLIMSPSALPQTGVTAEGENACKKKTTSGIPLPVKGVRMKSMKASRSNIDSHYTIPGLPNIP